MKPAPLGAVTVCYVHALGTACNPVVPGMANPLPARFQTATTTCSGPPPATGPTEATASNGAAECCYEVYSPMLCSPGRPLMVAAGMRVAPLSRTPEWARVRRGAPGGAAADA